MPRLERFLLALFPPKRHVSHHGPQLTGGIEALLSLDDGPHIGETKLEDRSPAHAATPRRFVFVVVLTKNPSRYECRLWKVFTLMVA